MPGRRGIVGVRDPDHDPVVGVQRLHVHAAVALAEPGRDCQRPGRVQLRAVRAVQHQAPVAELVAEPLEHQGAVVGQVAGGLALLMKVGDQVGGRQVVQALAAQPGSGGLLGNRAELAAERADRRAELSRTAGRVTLPERQPARLAGRGRDEHLVGGDVLDPPGRRAKHEHVADPGLVHHLLVQLTDPAGMPARAVGLSARQEHAEQAAVRDGPAVGHGQPLAARPAGQRPGGAVPDQPGPQASEVLARVPAGQHVQHGVEHWPGQPGERRRAAHGPLELSDVPVVHGRHRDDLLGEDIERIARHPQFLDLPGPHALGHDGGLDQVTLVLREEDAAGLVAHVVARRGRFAAVRLPPTAATRPG